MTVVLIACIAVADTNAQWLDRPSAPIPPLATGEPNLSAPAPRTAESTPDLTGVWQPAPEPVTGGRGVEATGAAPRYLFDITRDMPDRDTVMTPWASEFYQQPAQNSWRENPLIRCQPAGVPVSTRTRIRTRSCSRPA